MSTLDNEKARPVDEVLPVDELTSMPPSGDEGYEVYRTNVKEGLADRTSEEQVEWEIKSRKVAKRFDKRLLAMMCFLVGINYIDKAALAWAVLFDFRSDLGLVGKDYSWISSIFYFGYLAGQIPSFYLTARAPLAKVIGITCCLWGVLMLGSMGCKNYHQMLAVRFLLGFFEAPIVPALVSYTALFWTRKENAARTLIWGAMQGAFYLVFSLVAFGLGHIKSEALRPWAWIFLVLGLLSILLGLAWFIFMPDTPLKARFLNEEEQVIALERVAENMTGTKGQEIKMQQIVDTLKDPMYYLTVIYVFVMMVPNGLSSFNTLVIQSFGFNPLNTLLVGLPSSIVSAGSLFAWSLAARKYGGLRTIGMALPLIPAIAGMATVYATTYGDYSKWGRAFAYWLVNSYAVCWPFLQAHLGVNFAGHTKRSFIYGSILCAFSAGNIVGPFIFPSGSSNYEKALAIILVFFCVQILLAVVIRFYMVWDNSKRDRQFGQVDRNAETQGALDGLMDKTDRENKNFRYVL